MQCKTGSFLISKSETQLTFYRVIVCSVMSCSAIATSLQAEDDVYACTVSS